jgi:hypothetical protein
MAARGAEDTVHEVTGIIREVDPLERTLRVYVAGQVTAYDVAPDCEVLLHGERVKLRLLQPLDCAHIAYTETAIGPRAHRVRVNWWFLAPEESQQARQLRPGALAAR